MAIGKTKPGDSLYRKLPSLTSSKGEHRRLQLIQAAIQLLARDGLHRFSLEEVGHRAAMRRSHVVYYFATVESLLEAVIRHVVSVGQQITVTRLQTVEKPQDRIVAHGEATYDWFRRYPDHAHVMLLLQYYGAVRPEYRDLNAVIREAGEERLQAILASGPVRKGVGPQALRRAASQIRAQLMGSLTQTLTTTPEKLDESWGDTRTAILAVAATVWTKVPS